MKADVLGIRPWAMLEGMTSLPPAGLPPAGSKEQPTGVRRAIRWLLVSRRNGRITVAQWPNVPLAAFIVLALVVRFLHPRGGAEAALHGLAVTALAVWAIDEVVRGVNPFRRVLGAGVLLSTLVMLWG